LDFDINGLFLGGCDDAYIAGNFIDAACETGIYLIGCLRSTVESNEIDTQLGNYGIYVESCFDGIATGNTIYDSEFGMFFGGVSGKNCIG